MDDGKVIAHGAPKEILAKANKTTLDDAFIALLPPEKRGQHQEVIVRAARRQARTKRRRSRRKG